MIYDEEHGYLAGVLAEYLAGKGHAVIFVTTANLVSPFTELTLEQKRVQRSLIEKGVMIMTAQAIDSIEKGGCRLACVYTGRQTRLEATTTLLVTQRERIASLHDSLHGQPGLTHVDLIGDAAAPGLIADAVYSGHKAARDFERARETIEQESFRRETTAIEV